MSFIVAEGIDGAGKSTVLAGLAAHFVASGRKVLSVREPGSTPLGERIRAILLDPLTGELLPWTEACLFTACRAELIRTVIRPALQRGETVLLDRYFYSTFAYQGHATGADIEALRAMNLEAVGGLLPEVVLLLDLPVEIALTRLVRTRDRMEEKGAAFLSRVRAGFLAEARRDPARFHVLDATRPPADLIRDTLRLLVPGGA